MSSGECSQRPASAGMSRSISSEQLNIGGWLTTALNAMGNKPGIQFKLQHAPGR